MNLQEIRIPLEGAWNLTLQAEHGKKEVCGTVHLPSTVTEQGFGEENREQELFFLSERRKFVGMAAFERAFDLPDFGGSRVLFCMERTRMTAVFVNGIPAGKRDALTTEQQYDITRFVHPGRNHILVEVDNTYRDAPRDAILGSHMATEHTQTNWNGILGRIEIRLIPFFQPAGIRVLPDAQNKSALVKIDFAALPDTCRSDSIPVHLCISQPDFPEAKGEAASLMLKKRRETGDEARRCTLASEPSMWTRTATISASTDCARSFARRQTAASFRAPDMRRWIRRAGRHSFGPISPMG